MKAKDIDLAYFAGLFDGEGCLHIRKTKTKVQKTTYALVCKISMCNFSILEQLQQTFGGSLHKEREHQYSNKYNKLWTWTLSCVKARDFIIAILPFLRIKKSEAELAITFQAGKARTHKSIPKTESKLAIEETQYILMRNLKQGVVI